MGLVARIACASCCILLCVKEPVNSQHNEVLKSEFWRDQALTKLIPLWYEHVRDTQYGGFYMNLSRSWQPTSPWGKYPVMINRLVFGWRSFQVST